jgi:hypothetical protein
VLQGTNAKRLSQTGSKPALGAFIGEALLPVFSDRQRDMAKLPKSLIQKPRPTLESIEVGETVYVQSSSMRVTAKRECFLQPTAEYRSEASFLSNLSVKRAKDGFHVAVLSNANWEANAPQRAVKDWLPVASIVVNLDPKLDMSAQLKGLEKLAEKAAKGAKRAPIRKV